MEMQERIELENCMKKKRQVEKKILSLLSSHLSLPSTKQKVIRKKCLDFEKIYVTCCTAFMMIHLCTLM